MDNQTEKVGKVIDHIAKTEDRQTLDRLLQVAFDPGEDDCRKQEKSNDVMEQTVAVKEATKYFLDNSPEARRQRALAAREETERNLGKPQALRDNNVTKTVTAQGRRFKSNI